MSSSSSDMFPSQIVAMEMMSRAATGINQPVDEIPEPVDEIPKSSPGCTLT